MAPWAEPASIECNSATSGSDTESDAESITDSDTDGLVLPKMGEGYTTRKGKDYRAKSTWYLKSWSQKTFSERVLGLLYRPEMESQYFITDVDRGPIPRGDLVSDNIFIFSCGMLPIVLQSIAYWSFPRTRYRSSSRFYSP